MWARRRMPPFFFLFLGWLVLLVAAGCRGNPDLIEAELRTRENELHEAKAEVNRLQAFNQGLVQELEAVRHGALKLTPELASQTYTLRNITLGGSTGGYDDDNCPGDEALRVVIQPRDCDNHIIKAPGCVHIEALEISPEGTKAPMCSWDLDSQQIRPRWQDGLFSIGYNLILPWKTLPSMERQRVIVQFRLADGRLFEADKDITLRLARRGHPFFYPGHVPGEGPNLAVPEEGPTLPVPRILTPGPGQQLEKEIQPTASWKPAVEPALANAVRMRTPVPLVGGY
jgi:hypothetical protein